MTNFESRRRRWCELSII